MKLNWKGSHQNKSSQKTWWHKQSVSERTVTVGDTIGPGEKVKQISIKVTKNYHIIILLCFLWLRGVASLALKS